MKYAAVWRVAGSCLKRKRLLLVALGGFLAVSVGLELLPPLLIRRVIDHNLALGVQDGLWLLAAACLGALISAQAVTFLQFYATTIVGQHILFELRRALADHLRRLPLRYYDATPVGEIMSRCTADVESVNTLYSSGVVNMLADTVRASGILFGLVALNRQLALVTLPVLIAVLAATEFFRRRIRRAEQDTRRAVGQINANFQESLAGIKVIHIFNQEERFLAVLQRSLGKFLASTTKASLYNAFFPPVMDMLRASLIGALLWLGAKSFLAGNAITVGTLVAFVQLVIRLFAPLTALSDEFQTIQQALAGVERIDEVLRQPSEERPPWIELPDRLEGRVEISGLTFGYHPDTPVLKGMDLSIAPGARVAVVGRTGAGKTTLMSLLAGMYVPSRGMLTIDGLDPRRVRPEDRRRLIGVVPQAIQLFEGTVRDNIVLGDPRISEEDVAKVLALTQLDAVVARLPEGLDTKLGSGGAKLSHGEEQLLSLARALVLDPALLLLDEPTSGVDVDTERILFAAIRAQSKQRTTITISHRLGGVIGADRVLIMAHGVVVQDGKPEELLKRDGWYAVFRTLENLGWAE